MSRPTLADFWQSHGPILRDPRHPLHEEVSQEARALAKLEAGPRPNAPADGNGFGEPPVGLTDYRADLP